MPEWLSLGAAMRLLQCGGYLLRNIDGISVIEPEQGVGPAYAQDSETADWFYLYDVAVGIEAAVGTGGDVAVC